MPQIAVNGKDLKSAINKKTTTVVVDKNGKHMSYHKVLSGKYINVPVSTYLGEWNDITIDDYVHLDLSAIDSITLCELGRIVAEAGLWKNHEACSLFKNDIYNIWIDRDGTLENRYREELLYPLKEDE